MQFWRFERKFEFQVGCFGVKSSICGETNIANRHLISNCGNWVEIKSTHHRAIDLKNDRNSNYSFHKTSQQPNQNYHAE